MVAYRADHYIFILWFLSICLSIFFFFLFFFPRLISAAEHWMSTILSHMVCLSVNLECRSETCCTRLAENAGRKKIAKSRHLRTIVQLCPAIYSQRRHVSTVGKKFLSSNISPRCLRNMVNFGLLPAEIGPVVGGTAS